MRRNRSRELPDTQDSGENEQFSLRSSLRKASLSLSLASIAILMAGGAIYLVVPELQTPGTILIAGALTVITILILNDIGSVRNVLTARTGKYTTNTLVMILAFSAIVILLAYISFQNPHRIDMTATRQFTLSPQTHKVLSELDEKVEATGYFSPSDITQQAVKRTVDDFLHEFSRRNRNFSYEFIDPDLKPSKARRDGVTQYPTIVFKAVDSDKNPYRFTPAFFENSAGQATFNVSEQDLVSSLLIVTGTEQKTLYFTTGHGERNLTDTEEQSAGYGFARRGLIGENYKICSVNLRQIATIPTTTTGPNCGEVAAAVLIVAGPHTPFLKDEREIVQEYLLAGGRTLFLVDTHSNSSLSQILQKWGVSIIPGAIVDLGNSLAGDPRSPLVRRSQYNQEHPITIPLDDTFFSETAGILDTLERSPEGLPPNPDEQNINLNLLAESSVFSCITDNKDQIDCYDLDDIPGPHAIAVTIEALAPVGSPVVNPYTSDPDGIHITSIVVFGDSDFASNKFYYAFSNGDFFINAVDWLAQRYDLISIRPKPQAFRQLIVNQREFDFIRYSSWFLMPSTILMLAGLAWWRQR